MGYTYEDMNVVRATDLIPLEWIFATRCDGTSPLPPAYDAGGRTRDRDVWDITIVRVWTG
jgi:hypothetical protein